MTAIVELSRSDSYEARTENMANSSLVFENCSSENHATPIKRDSCTEGPFNDRSTMEALVSDHH